MAEDVVISVKGLVKEYELYDKNIDQLKEIFSIRRKKYHRDFKALDNINFEVLRGEHLGIIGTNGSGKSTLLKILTGVVTPSSGKVLINGKISALLELGAGFNPNYTGMQNIYLNGSVMGYDHKNMESRVNQIVEFADIGDFINQPVKNYSSGMFARLAFAVAISIEPEILIVDEALSVGDIFFQIKCYKKFEELKSKGTTILFVSHDLESVKRMCDRVLWIEQGKQRMFGDRNEVCNAYFNLRMQKQNENAEIHKNSETENILSEKIEEEHHRYPGVSAKTGDITSDRVQIKSAFILNEEQQIIGSLVGDKKYSVEVVVQVNDDISQIIVGFNLTNAKGIDFFGMNTYDHTRKWIDVKNGDLIHVSFEFTMPKIARGNYALDCAVAEGIQEEHIMLTWLHGVHEVEVTWKGYEFGVVTIPYEFQVEEVHSAEFY
jgi:ABC-type polysaccharide/polyol phosphate transport system ATPase subunit